MWFHRPHSDSASCFQIICFLGLSLSIPYALAIDGVQGQNHRGKAPADDAYREPPPVLGDLAHPPKGHPKFDFKLVDTPECGEEVRKYCSDRMRKNNFLVLECLQNDEGVSLSQECHHFLWTFKYNLTRHDGFDRTSKKDCSADLQKLVECRQFREGEGKRIPCLIEHFDEIDEHDCKNFLMKMATIIFSDYRFMEFFISDCHSDIISTKCGRLPGEEEDDSPHLQGSVVACLDENWKTLGSKCRKSLLKVAEVQSDDYHIDRPLYYACRGDREIFCSDVVAGGGAVFECLYKQLGNPKLSEECRKRVEIRQQLIEEDIKIDKSFYVACKPDIIKYNCAGTSKLDDSDLSPSLGRSRILLCLEDAQNSGKKVQSECLQQMFELRTELMEDYKISPELVSKCEKEIVEFCDGLREEGSTITCLISKIAQTDNKDKVGYECLAALTRVLEVIQPFEDILLDRPLQKDCGDLVRSACKNEKPGEGNVITCLLENLDHEDMTDECEDRLLEIQYFVVRDFRLDHHLYKACRKDAEDMCHTTALNNPQDLTPEQGPLTFACLHRHLNSHDEKDPKLSKGCAREVRRIMKERGDRIELIPEVEQACIKDLAEFCSDDEEHVEKGGEMACLQTHLDDLSDICKELVTTFTQEESEMIEMDRILMKACLPMMGIFCKELLETRGLPEEIIGCLIENKNHANMDYKCAAGVEHHQLLTTADFRFNKRFREACQESVGELCKNTKTKYDVVACLSEHVRNDTFMEKEHRVKRACRKQLRFELLQRGENIKLDPELAKKCEVDVKKFCHDSSPGNAEIIECLREHQKRLSPECHKLLFQREEISAVVGDYSLLHTCKKMIRYHCKMDMTESEIFDCLKKRKDDMDFDENCRKLIVKRQIEQSQDFRLNPNIQKACYYDIPKFCSHIYQEGLPETELEGKVINCLKKKFISKTQSLSRDCEFQIKNLVKESALDINQNPVLMHVCKSDIKKLCVNEIQNIKVMEIDDGTLQTAGEGAVMECLKQKFRDLKDPECKKEVAFAISESRIDVNVDPLLHKICQIDLISLCDQVPLGQGRQMACLLAHLESNPDQLSVGCKGMLDRRKNLWEFAAQVAPIETFSEFFEQVKASPKRNYLLAILFTVIGVIFIVGITCGRVTKRVRAEVKNK